MARNKAMMSYRQDSTNETTNVVRSSTPSAPTHEAIEKRAYQIFLARGNQAGTAVDDWVRAEQELKEHADPQDE